jgi:hypothetical protein
MMATTIFCKSFNTIFGYKREKKNKNKDHRDYTLTIATPSASA